MRKFLGSALTATVILLTTSACDANANQRTAGATGTAISEPSPNATGAPASSVVASFGKIENFVSFEKTESILGWRVLRPSDPKYILGRQGGLLRTLTSVNLPRLEQAYSLEGHGDTAISITQGPEAYGTYESDVGEDVTMGPWRVNLRRSSGRTGVVFFSGEVVSGQRIVVLVTSDSKYSVDEVRSFVESLAFAP